MIHDLFSGPGGLDVGLAMLGRTDVVGFELDAAACATGRAAGHQRVQCDIAITDPAEWPGDVEGLVGGPPCKGFSPAGKGTGRLDTDAILAAVAAITAGQRPDAALGRLRDVAQDPRSPLVLEPLRWALETEPDWIVCEQVARVLPLWQAVAEVLRADGYNVWTGKLHAEQYGVPQTRQRALLIASRTQTVDRPTPTHSRFYPRSPGKLDAGVQKWVSMADALGPGYVPEPAIAGETAEDCAWVYDRPSPTIVGSFRPDVVAKPGYRKKGDPSRQNTPGSVLVTVQQAAALQSFPAGYPWQGSVAAQYRQIGDAVPPLLAAHALMAAGVSSPAGQLERLGATA